MTRTRSAHGLGLAIAGAALAAALLAGCGDATAGGGDSSGGNGDEVPGLDGRTFLSTAVTPALEPGTRLRVSFDGDEIGVHAGCNHLFGTVQAEGGRLTVTGVGGTEMACEEPLMQQDERVADFLLAGPTYVLAEDTLTLTGDDTTIEFVDEEVAIPDAALTGTEWVLEGIVSGSDETGAVGSVPAGVRSTLRFTAGGRLYAELGCNGGGGQVTVTDSTLDIRKFGRTLVACPGPRQEVEDTVAGVLMSDAEVGYVLDGETLTLRSGPTGLIYRAAG